jgi:hypothetical protein
MHIPRPRTPREHQTVTCSACGHFEELGHPVRRLGRVLVQHRCSAVIDMTSIAGDEYCGCPALCHH